VAVEPADVDLSEALHALPVPEHGTGFWARLQERLVLDDASPPGA
jgi:hypothetical protein